MKDSILLGMDCVRFDESLESLRRAKTLNGVLYGEYTESGKNRLLIAPEEVGRNGLVGYVVLPQFVGAVVDLPDDEPYPFSEFDESDATTVCEIAQYMLETSGHFRTMVSRYLDIAESELERLTDLLKRTLETAA